MRQYTIIQLDKRLSLKQSFFMIAIDYKFSTSNFLFFLSAKVLLREFSIRMIWIMIRVISKTDPSATKESTNKRFIGSFDVP